ncbi:MAG TPA: nucleotide pyrophosphatase/phosphodiesterase family protein [Candidatus Saccharimonadales bacterium]|nr:nucleotide pyrophosphatase/phosphodiesterase family protein [Candidatus Saccharimonadales bacterium]
MSNNNNSSSSSKSKYFIILDIVGLDVSHLDSRSQKYPNIYNLISGEEGGYGYMKPVFPSVTCTVQSSITTGKYPSQHGIISNGMFDRDNLQILFWEQSTHLVQSEKSWDVIKKQNNDLKTAMLFWQNSLYTNNDIVVSPRPIHLENGQMDLWCYSKPVNFYEDIMKEAGEFNLMNYWGPFASMKSSEWITRSVQYTIEKERPNLLYAYFPQLDYTAQKHGKGGSQVQDDLQKLDTLIGSIMETIKNAGIYDQTQFLLLSEYGFNDVNKSISINRTLREKGLLQVRTIKNKEYIDFEYSEAFAMVDHQVAHIYLNSVGKSKITLIKKTLEEISGIESVCDEEEKKKLHVNHQRCGDLVAIADKDKWFSYYWWYDDDKSPSFTKTVDIHRKPGYDPLDLFIDPQRKCISTNTDLIKGSHGRPFDTNTGEGLSAFASNKKIDNSILKETYNGHPIINCLDIFQLVTKNFI